MDTPRLFTNTSGSMFQYPDARPDWRWGLLKHNLKNKILCVDILEKSVMQDFLPPNWVSYCLVADALD